MKHLLISAILFAAACGGSDSTMPEDMSDPSSPDNPDDPGQDPSDPVPSSGPCSIDTSVQGLNAALHDASGEVVATTDTGSDGIAWFADCTVESAVSFMGFDERSTTWRGVTVGGMGPELHYKVTLPSIGWKGTLVTDVPDDNSEIIGARLYAARNCSTSTSKSTAQELPMTADCLGQNEDAVSAIASGRINGIWVYAYSNTEVPRVNNGVTNLDPEHMDGWMTGGSVEASAVNASGMSVSFSLEWMRNGLSFGSSSWVASVDEGSASRSLPTPPSGFSTAERIGVSSGGKARSGLVVYNTGAAIELDLDDALPVMTGLGFDATDAIRPTFSAEGIPQDGDLALYRSYWFDENDDEVQWWLIAPAQSASTVTMPALPDDWSAIRPSDTLDISDVTIIDMTEQDYEGILRDGFGIEKYQRNCGDVSESQDCRFSFIQG